MSDVAKHIIQKCGGAQAVAAMLSMEVSSVHRWKYPVERGGTGGYVPTARQRELMERARERGIKLRPHDFFDPPPKADNTSSGEAA